jgi:probable addiction module antidote protein
MVLETKPFDAAEYLDSPEAIAVFLEDIFESGDDALIASALGVVARAKSMWETAANTSASDQALASSGDSRPEFATVMRLLSSVGVTLKPTVAA